MALRDRNQADSPHKGTVMWKAFPCDDITMAWNKNDATIIVVVHQAYIAPVTFLWSWH